MRTYRHNAVFVMNIATICTKMDRNDKAKLLHKCEVLERLTKRRGCRNGVVGLPGLIVLRTLLLKFHGPQGLCCPSYATLQRQTGLCRQSIATALRKLRALGVVRVTSRLARAGGSCRQITNAYQFSSLPPMVYGVVTNYKQGFPGKRFKARDATQLSPSTWCSRPPVSLQTF